MLKITLACGHTIEMGHDSGVPICPQCGERRVSQVVARPPRFTGVCQGPYATYAPLSGIPVKVGEHSDA